MSRAAQEFEQRDDPSGLGLVVAEARSQGDDPRKDRLAFVGLVDPSAYERLHAGDTIRIPNIGRVLTSGEQCVATVDGSTSSITPQHYLSERQIEILMAGGAINWRDNHRTR